MDEETKIDIPKLKVNPKKMWQLLICLFVIFAVLLYYILNPLVRVDTLIYTDNCTETYINGELNSSMCPMNIYNTKINISDGIFTNLNFSTTNNNSSPVETIW